MKLKQTLALLLCMAITTTINAQVTIGSTHEPSAGALLDLKTESDGSSKQGLGLPRVVLTEKNPTTDAQLALSIGGTGSWNMAAHAGMVIYNVNEIESKCILPGMYVWDGAEWSPLTPGPTDSGESTRDSLALVALYNSTNGAGWTDNTNWLTSARLSTWYGLSVTNTIKCLNDKPTSIPSVKSIYLNSNQLSGTIPSEIANLQDLQQLDLDDNQLTGSIPDGITNLTNLIYLVLRTNQLTGTIPANIGNLKKVYYFDLSTNQLTGSIPASTGDMTALSLFTLRNNKLSGTLPSELGNLTKLSQVRIENNQLSGTIPTNMFSISKLEVCPQWTDEAHTIKNTTPWSNLTCP